LSIAAVADQVGELGLPDPVELAPGLRELLAGVDPRKRRGIRHGLVVVLSAAVCAVVAGARSFVAVAEWVADVPGEVAAALGIERQCTAFRARQPHPLRPGSARARPGLRRRRWSEQ
jgi:hypothetical protein